MSKSKRNTVDPGAIIAQLRRRHGALVHPVRQPARARHGVDGSRRGRRLPLHPALCPHGGRRAAGAAAGRHAPLPEAEGAARKLRQATHRTIAAVTEALESFAFNVAVARIHEFANAIDDAEATSGRGMGAARREALETLARLSAPMMPHLAEEIWSLLRPGDAALVARTALAGGRSGAAEGGDGDAGRAGAGQAARDDRGAGRRRRGAHLRRRRGRGERAAARSAASPIRKRIHVPGRVVNFVV